MPDGAGGNNRAPEIEARGVRDPRDARRLPDLEDEIESHKKKLAEQPSMEGSMPRLHL